LLGGQLVDIGDYIVFVEHVDHSRAIDEGLGYCLGINLFHAELAHQEHIQHCYWQFAGAKLAA